MPAAIAPPSTAYGRQARQATIARRLASFPEAGLLAIAGNVARSGRNKGRLRRVPPMVPHPGPDADMAEGKNCDAATAADAYLWRLFYDHARNPYLNITDLMQARWFYGAELCDLWEATVDVQAAIARVQAAR